MGVYHYESNEIAATERQIGGESESSNQERSSEADVGKGKDGISDHDGFHSEN